MIIKTRDDGSGVMYWVLMTGYDGAVRAAYDGTVCIVGGAGVEERDKI